MLRLLYVVSLLAQHSGCVRVHACRELCDYHNDETRIISGAERIHPSLIPPSLPRIPFLLLARLLLFPTAGRA